MSLEGSAKSYTELKGSMSLPKSIQGKSAYEIALLNGYKGTEAEWLESLTEQTRANAAEVIAAAEQSITEMEAAGEEALSGIAEAKATMLNEIEIAAEVVQTTGESETAVMSQKAVTDEFGNIVEHSPNIINPAKVEEGKRLISEGQTADDTSQYVTDYVRVKGSHKYYYSHFKNNSKQTSNVGERRVAFYDKNKTYISMIFQTEVSEDDTSFTTPANTEYIRMSNSQYYKPMALYETEINEYIPFYVTLPENTDLSVHHIDNSLSVEGKAADAKAVGDRLGDVEKIFAEPRNLFAKAKLVEGYYYNASDSAPVQSASYNFFKGIQLEPNVTYGIYPQCRFVANHTDKVNISSSEVIGLYTFSVDKPCEVWVSFATKYTEQMMLFNADKYSFADVEEYTQKRINTDKVIIPSNILYGKKWYACGDSFTQWATETFDANEYPNITGNSHYKTYPFFIGVRNGMTVHNFAEGGQTMATPATGGFTNCFSRELYKQIPKDTDYITLWFGINDSHHRSGSAGGDGEDNTGVIPLGTINDTTTATFYGAWNVVMEYLIANHPFAHIGIIISNGCETTEYPQAEIAIAKKWGVAYLDLNGDYQVPMMHRTNTRTETCARAQELRKNAFWASVEDGNGHPSTKAHEYQSTFIEHWLRSL